MRIPSRAFAATPAIACSAPVATRRLELAANPVSE
jgi:hypothetical protein